MKRLSGELPLEQWLKAGVLLAVSGGADSVAMFRFFQAEHAKLFGNVFSPDQLLVVAHLNHALRGEESDGDAFFVRQLAKRFSLPYIEQVVRPDDWSNLENGSFEADAREIRYEFLRKTASEHGLRLIAVAHTKDDQVETVVHRIVRGTGLAGLAGIPTVRALNEAVSVIRPFLSVSRAEILQYLQDLGQDFRTDSSNQSLEWTRNRIRLELLPFLRKTLNPNVDEAILQLASLAGEQQQLIDEWADTVLEKVLIRQTNNQTINDPGFSIVLNLDFLAEQNVLLIRQVLLSIWKRNRFPLQEMGFVKWTVLAQAIAGRKKSRRQFPGDVEVIVDPENGTIEIAGPRS